MSPPARSLRLIRRHIRGLRISRTTFIVTVYLVTNVFGRLTVAIFGLAYNMMDQTGIEYPILATNWTSVSWTSHVNATDEVLMPYLFNLGAAEGKDTSLKNLHYSCKPALTHLKRIVEFGMEWIARVHQDP